MKNCSKCGTSFEDDKKFCPNCGAEVSETAETGESSNENKSSNKRLPIIIGIAAAAVIVIVIILIASCSGGYKSALSNYEKLLNGNFDDSLIEKLAPEDYWDYIDDNFNMDASDISKSLEDEYEEEAMFGLDGDEIKYSLSIAKASKLDDDVFDEIKDRINDNCDVSKKSITEAYRLLVDFKYKFDIDKADDDYILYSTIALEDGSRSTFYSVKIDGKWYLFDSSLNSVINPYQFSY
jgi:uncharacterized membrane protein YvbJ